MLAGPVRGGLAPLRAGRQPPAIAPSQAGTDRSIPLPAGVAEPTPWAEPTGASRPTAASQPTTTATATTTVTPVPTPTEVLAAPTGRVAPSPTLILTGVVEASAPGANH